jgi:hypothetical protein
MNESDLALHRLRCILNGSVPEVIATAVFHRLDGSTVVFDNVNVDSIGPSAEQRGVIGVEFDNDPDRVVHVPFVSHWEISYSYL